MINVIMKDLWERKFMSQHSLSGHKLKKNKADTPAKPALPPDSVQAIMSIHFILSEKKQCITIYPVTFFFRLCHRILEKAIHHHSRSKAH
jgi:hypothetical protein